MDVESQIKGERPRVRFLDVFLVGSVVLLFLAIVAVVVMGTKAVSGKQSKIEIPLYASADFIKEPSPYTPYKKQNFAYIQPSTSELQNSGTMSWRSQEYGETDSIGSLYVYDDTISTLKTKIGGIYFLYMELQLNCTANCQQGKVTVHVMGHQQNLLTCEVDLPELTDSKNEKPQTAVSKRCWTVVRLKSDSQLLGRMVVLNPGFWKLDRNKSGMGIFLVGSD